LLDGLNFFIKFADDGKGAKIVKDTSDAAVMQETLTMLCSWAEKWGMSFNEKKCRGAPDIRPDNPAFFDIRYPAGYPAGYPVSGFWISRISGHPDIQQKQYPVHP
jgi:hypothetical protein